MVYLLLERQGCIVDRPPRALKFVHAALQHLSPERCVARVELERPESGSYVGTAVGACPDVEGLRATAEAAVQALVQAAGADTHSLGVRNIELIEAFGQAAVLVHLSARHGGETRDLIGFCLLGTDSARAATLAVLNAANRFLGVG